MALSMITRPEAPSNVFVLYRVSYLIRVVSVYLNTLAISMSLWYYDYIVGMVNITKHLSF